MLQFDKTSANDVDVWLTIYDSPGFKGELHLLFYFFLVPLTSGWSLSDGDLFVVRLSSIHVSIAVKFPV